MSDRELKLVGNRLLAKNVVWSFLGTGLPVLVAIVAIPVLIEAMGTARFGVLTLVWMVVGYFSLFDLGLGRALTKLVAERLGSGKNEEIPGIVWSAMSLMTVLGVLGAIVIVLLSPWLVYDLLKIPEVLHKETLTGFYYLAFSLPIVISTTGLRGILEANQRFGLVNIISAPMGVMTFLGPLIVLQFTNTLPAMVIILAASRALSWVAYLYVCLKLYPDLRRSSKLDRESARKLLAFGGWMTVSNITAPLLLYLGRVLIIIMISAEAVAYFVTPYEVVTKLLIIPGVLVGVLFPAFTHRFQSQPDEVVTLYNKTLLLTLVIMLPLSAIVFLFAESGLQIWINEEFSTHGYQVAQLLAIGVFINSFGHLSQALVQGYGRPDLTAKLHLMELVAYVPYLWYLVDLFGIVGAALAWTIRVSISTLVLFWLAKKCIYGSLAIRY